MMMITVIVTSLLCYEDREVCVWWCEVGHTFIECS